MPKLRPVAVTAHRVLQVQHLNKKCKFQYGMVLRVIESVGNFRERVTNYMEKGKK